MYMKELQACSYVVSLNSDTLLNCAYYYTTVFITHFLLILISVHQIRQLAT